MNALGAWAAQQLVLHMVTLQNSTGHRNNCAARGPGVVVSDVSVKVGAAWFGSTGKIE
jgi:hypothetical protein